MHRDQTLTELQNLFGNVDLGTNLFIFTVAKNKRREARFLKWCGNNKDRINELSVLVKQLGQEPTAEACGLATMVATKVLTRGLERVSGAVGYKDVRMLDLVRTSPAEPLNATVSQRRNLSLWRILEGR